MYKVNTTTGILFLFLRFLFCVLALKAVIQFAYKSPTVRFLFLVFAFFVFCVLAAGRVQVVAEFE